MVKNIQEEESTVVSKILVYFKMMNKLFQGKYTSNIEKALDRYHPILKRFPNIQLIFRN